MVSIDLDVNLRTLRLMLLGWDYTAEEISKMSDYTVLKKIELILSAYCVSESLKVQEEVFFRKDREVLDSYLKFLGKRDNG